MLRCTRRKISRSMGLIVFTTLGWMSLPASAQHTLPLEVADQHPLVIAFKPCVSAIGLEHDLPLANPVPALKGPGHLYQLNDVGRIRDGYRHSLYVSEDGKSIYIVQVGGFAGTYKVFGPLYPEKNPCAIKKAESS